MLPNTIDEVLSQLQKIISESEQSGQRSGYFAALYFKVTARVKEGIAKNEFENGNRMEKLDVLFANRYLDAIQQWKNQQPLSGSWRVAFEATHRSSLLVLQHLLLGVNAHINLDLGIAAAQTMQDQQLEDIHKDFDAINAIIGSLTYEVIHEINRISPLLSLIGLHSSRTDSILIQFSIENARDGAWVFAEDLFTKTGNAKTTCIDARDADITKLASALAKTKGFVRFTIWIIHLFEWKRPGKIIRLLHGYTKTFIKAATVK